MYSRAFENPYCIVLVERERERVFRRRNSYKSFNDRVRDKTDKNVGDVIQRLAAGIRV